MSDRPKNGEYFHITYNNNKWHVKEVKNYRGKTFFTKEEAIKEAKELAEKSPMGYIVLHNKKGKFESLKNF